MRPAGRREITTVSRALASLLVIGAAVLAPAVARAETTAIVVAGDPSKKATVVDAVSPWLEARGQSIVFEALPPEDLDKLTDCFVGSDEATCAERVVSGVDVDRLVFVMVQLPRGDTSDVVELTGILHQRGGKVLAVERRTCDACRIDKLAKTAEELIERLWRAADPSKATIKLTSTPAGADVTIDGQPVGKTPVAYEVTPGAHEIRYELAGHVPKTHKIDVKGGKVEDVDLTLDRIGGPRRSLRPWIVIGSGALAVVLGGVLFALDEDQPPLNPTGPEKKTYFDSAPYGVVLLTAGAAAVGAGVYLLRKERRSVEGPAIAVTRGGGLVTWSGSF